jgi:hypothetical protein
MNKRVIYGIILGSILGVFCIVGATLRSTESLSFIYLFSFWYNRVIMGLVIGLLPRPRDLKIGLLRGLIFGGLISFAFYGATDFNDLMGFLAGFAYGIIIEFVLFKYINNKGINV